MFLFILYTFLFQYKFIHKAHLHWQKPKSQKPEFFVVPFTLPEKPITFGVFGTKSACAKNPESHNIFVYDRTSAMIATTIRP